MNLRFPADRVKSPEEFAVWAGQLRPLLDQRWLHEQQQIAAGVSALRQGTCGLCLMPTEFRSDEPPEQRNWREEMRCGCAHQLSNRQRALLHFAQARAGMTRGCHPVLIGPESSMEAKLAEWRIAATRVARLVEGRLRLPDAGADQVLCADYLQHVPAVGVLLHECARILRPGGSLLLTLPFDVNSASTKSRPVELPRAASDSAAALHLFGWDLLDWLRDLGFAQVAAHFYWSDEFGYLGAFNMVVQGVRV